MVQQAEHCWDGQAVHPESRRNTAQAGTVEKHSGGQCARVEATSSLWLRGVSARNEKFPDTKRGPGNGDASI